MRSLLDAVYLTIAVAVLGLSAGAANAQHTLTTGVGDGSVTLSVDGAGAFGGAIYDPVGAIGPADTTFSSWVAHRVGPTGPRAMLSGAGAPTGTATSCTSSFTVGSLSFNLVQSVAPLTVGGTQTGSVLTQAYTVTNTGAATVDFDLVRYYDGDLLFDGTLVDGGGRLPGPPETLFETDAGGGGSTATTFVGLTGTGGTIPTTDRYEILNFGAAGSKVLAGTPLGNTIMGDGNADGFIDLGSEYDVVLVMRNVFTLAPGASVTYTSTTIFGSGAPSSVIGTPGVTIAPSGGSTSVAEGGITDNYTVVLNTAPTANVTITLNPGTQLTAAPATLTFTPTNWNAPQTVTVTAVDDAVVEGAHTGTITHTAASTDTGYNAVAIASVTANITDNDTGTPPPPPTPTPPPVGGTEGTYQGGSGGSVGSEGGFGFGTKSAAGLHKVLSTPEPDQSGHLVVSNVSHQRSSPGTVSPSSALVACAAAAGLLLMLAALLVGLRSP